MLAFSVTVNDNLLGICGFNDWSVLNADLIALREEGKEASDSFERRVGGVESGHESDAWYHLRYIYERLDVGDKVEIEIVDSAEIMEPIKRYRSDRTVQESPFTDEELEEMDRQAYEDLKAKFEPSSQDR